MALQMKHSTLDAIIMDPPLLLLNPKWEEYLELILISLGHLKGDIKMEMAIHLFSLSEMILILLNLNL